LHSGSYAITPDGTMIFVSSPEGGYYFYDFKKHKKRILPNNFTGFTGAEFSADNKLLLVSFAKYAMVLDLATMKWNSREIMNPGGSELRFSPDAKKIIQIEPLSKSICIYDAFTAEKLARISYADKKQTYFSPDAHTIYIWQYGQIRIFYQDLDVSPVLFKLQANVLTGGSLNLTTGEIEEIPTAKWQELRRQYDVSGRQHYENCGYQILNTWHRVHPAN
jgi:hypothetical protein